MTLDRSTALRLDEPAAVVIVTYNSAGVIDALLDSLPAAFGTLAYRTVVVDNASTDSTSDHVRRRGDAVVVEAANLGFGAGINTGVDALGGAGPILVLNPDVRLDKGSVESMMSLLQSCDAGVAVPRLRDEDGTTARSLRREPTIARTIGLGDSRFPAFSEVVNDARDYTRVHPVDWATGAVLLISRECFNRLRGFDESFFMYSEETDFCLRARDVGMLTYFVPCAGATHIGGGSGRNPDLYAMQVLNRIRLYRRRHSLRASLVLWWLTAVRELIHAACGSADSRRALAAMVIPPRKPGLLLWPGGPLRFSSPQRVH